MIQVTVEYGACQDLMLESPYKSIIWNVTGSTACQASQGGGIMLELSTEVAGPHVNFHHLGN